MEQEILFRFLNCTKEDPSIDSKHLAIYLVLFSQWVRGGYSDRFRIISTEIMSMSKISSTATYYTKIRDLNKLNYIRYYPDNCSIRGTYVGINIRNLNYRQ